MADYLEKYHEALRNGDEEEAHNYYKKYRDEGEETAELDDGGDEDAKFTAPGSMTVSEAKEYAGELPEEDVGSFLDSEREGKDRTTLVEYLEERLE